MVKTEMRRNAEPAALVDETRTLLLDMRSASAIQPQMAEPPREGETPIQHLSRSIRRQLPGDDASDLLSFREEFGWSELEVSSIISWLQTSRSALLELREGPLLSGTRDTLQRDADTILLNIMKWEELLPEDD